MDTASMHTQAAKPQFREDSRPQEPAREERLRDEWEQLAITLARSIQQRTGNAVRELRVEVDRQSVRLFGRCHSFYCKQLAQQSVMAIAADMLLTNNIEVT
jgi:hypothetical protein